jgi:CheY-like chemotaxis protein
MTLVLLVDDNPAVRHLLQVALELEDEDYLLMEASTGKEARDVLLAAREPLVVVLDYVLPDLDGVTLLEQLAVLAARRASPSPWRFILCSSWDPVAVAARCAPLRRRLPIQLVAKPFHMEELLMAIKRAGIELATTGNQAPRAPSVRSRRQRPAKPAPVRQERMG